MTEKSYSTAEAAKLLDVKERTLRDWIEAGTVKAFKSNPFTRSRYRIPVSEVERILDERDAQKGKG